jgi:hypothetical protein
MEPPGSARHRWGKPRGRNGREHISQPGKRTSVISSIAMRRRTDEAKEIMRPARWLYINLKDLTSKKEPHDEHITRLSRVLRLLTRRRA